MFLLLNNYGIRWIRIRIVLFAGDVLRKLRPAAAGVAAAWRQQRHVAASSAVATAAHQTHQHRRHFRYDLQQTNCVKKRVKFRCICLLPKLVARTCTCMYILVVVFHCKNIKTLLYMYRKMYVKVCDGDVPVCCVQELETIQQQQAISP